MKLRVILYQNCILNNTYKNIFSHGKYNGLQNNPSILDKYLSSLIHYTMDLEYVYYENSGTLVFDYETYNISNNSYNIYDFNYMLCIQLDDENNEKFRRYCFINKIEMKNEVVYLTYSEDIWSSYGNKIKGTTKAYLDRSRFHDYNNITIPLKSLPIDYESNDNSAIQLYENKVDKVYLIVQLQLYKLVTGTEENPKNFERKNIYVCIARHETYSTDEDVKLPLSVSYSTNLTDTLIKLFSLMPVAYYDTRIDLVSGDAKQWKFEIGNIYVLPGYFEFNFASPAQYEDCDYIYLGSPSPSTTGELYAFRISEYYNNSIFDTGNIGLKTIYSKTLENDYKNIAVGTFNSKIRLINNGSNTDIKVQALLEPSQISIFLNANNEILDITEDFNLNYPVESITSVEYMQRKISLSLQNRNLKYQEEQNALDMANDYIDKTYGGMSSILGNRPSYTKNSGIRTSKTNVMKLTNMGIGIAESFYGLIGDIVDTAQKGNYIKDQQIYINTPQYSSSKSNFNTNNNFINSVTGIVVFKCISENDYYVNNMIKDEGWVVYNYINNWSDLNLNDENVKTYDMYVDNFECYYNSIRFSSIDLYGSFTNEIASSLNNIFRQGVKIWFIDHIEENDNYDI